MKFEFAKVKNLIKKRETTPLCVSGKARKGGSKVLTATKRRVRLGR